MPHSSSAAKKADHGSRVKTPTGRHGGELRGHADGGSSSEGLSHPQRVGLVFLVCVCGVLVFLRVGLLPFFSLSSDAPSSVVQSLERYRASSSTRPWLRTLVPHDSASPHSLNNVKHVQHLLEETTALLNEVMELKQHQGDAHGAGGASDMGGASHGSISNATIAAFDLLQKERIRLQTELLEVQSALGDSEKKLGECGPSNRRPSKRSVTDGRAGRERGTSPSSTGAGSLRNKAA